MSYHKCNSSSIGTATHPEPNKRMYDSSCKKSKYKCCHFNKGANYCNALEITCVGCCSKLCNSYTSIYIKNSSAHIIPRKNMIVRFPRHGLGMIMAVRENSYMIKFAKDNSTKIYDLKTVQKYLLKENALI